jgi:CRISPR-associated protein Cmr5
MRTRAQADLILAEDLVSQVAERKNKELNRIYGGLCHQFPVMVLTCGLAQALAFSDSKKEAAGDRGEAHKLLLQHVAKLMGVSGTALEAVQSVDAVKYMLHTRRVLSGWIYFKRFAVSILKAEAGDDRQS